MASADIVDFTGMPYILKINLKKQNVFNIVKCTVKDNHTEIRIVCNLVLIFKHPLNL